MAIAFRRLVQTVDSHTEGNPTRVITGGVRTPPGDSLREKAEWLWRHDDGLRRLLNFEPRGNDMMCSVLLLPPLGGDADFAAIIMEQDEYVPMCGHCIIGAATTVVATGMVAVEEPVTIVRFETDAGAVRCAVRIEAGRVRDVSLENVESFLLHRDARVTVEGLGPLTLDVAFGGDFYVIADADPLGLALVPEQDAALAEAAARIIRAVADQLTIRHPLRPDITRCYEMLFTSADASVGDYKQTIVSPPGALDRSPCGGGTCARIAALHTRGALALDSPKRFEGVLGTCFTGTAVGAQERDGILYVRPRITGAAYLTGFHRFVLEADDPLPAGFRIGAAPRPAPGFA